MSKGRINKGGNGQEKRGLSRVAKINLCWHWLVY